MWRSLDTILLKTTMHDTGSSPAAGICKTQESPGREASGFLRISGECARCRSARRRRRRCGYYLPRYRLRQQEGRYEIALSLAQEGGWKLSAGLERYPAQELGALVLTQFLVESIVMGVAGGLAGAKIRHERPRYAGDRPFTRRARGSALPRRRNRRPAPRQRRLDREQGRRARRALSVGDDDL